MEVIDSVEREADGGERAREPAPIRLRHGGGTQRSACSQTSRGSCGRNRKGVTAGTERHCKSVHTRRYAVPCAWQGASACPQVKVGRGDGPQRRAWFRAWRAWFLSRGVGRAAGSPLYIHAKKNVHSGPAFQDTSVLWRSKCSKTSPVLCGEDAVSQLFAPNGKIPQRHTIYTPSLTIFKKGLRSPWTLARRTAYRRVCTTRHICCALYQVAPPTNSATRAAHNSGMFVCTRCCACLRCRRHPLQLAEESMGKLSPVPICFLCSSCR